MTPEHAPGTAAGHGESSLSRGPQQPAFSHHLVLPDLTPDRNSFAPISALRGAQTMGIPALPDRAVLAIVVQDF